jgi:hypothetical protein
LEGDDGETSPDIFEIVKVCLQDVKKLKSAHSLKVVTQLTAVVEYAKLRDQYQHHIKCKRPSLSASLAIARRMGKGRVGKKKGSYFAHQICQHEAYLLKHQCLPPIKAGAKHGQYTLLDNETVLHGVQRYLAAQNLGTITPKLLCHHVNETILPALDLTQKNASISEQTAVNWLKKLGYSCKDVRKGVYHDGHERPDVIKACKKIPGADCSIRMVSMQNLEFYQITIY